MKNKTKQNSSRLDGGSLMGVVPIVGGGVGCCWAFVERASPKSQICRRGVGHLLCKGWLSPICYNAWVSPLVAECISKFRAGAVGGCRQCVRWRQWLKVAEAEGVGPVGGGSSVGRRGRRKRFWGEKINPIRF